MPRRSSPLGKKSRPTARSPAAAKPSSRETFDATVSQEVCTRFGFTKAETVVAAMLIEGLSYGEIAVRLGVSYHTVHTHIKAIHNKARVTTTGRLGALLRGGPETSK